MVCLSLSFEKQSETVANSLAGGQKAKHPNEFKCNNKLKLEFEFKFKLVSWWTLDKRPNEFKCNNKLELYVNSISVYNWLLTY